MITHAFNMVSGKTHTPDVQINHYVTVILLESTFLLLLIVQVIIPLDPPPPSTSDRDPLPFSLIWLDLKLVLGETLEAGGNSRDPFAPHHSIR